MSCCNGKLTGVGVGVDLGWGGWGGAKRVLFNTQFKFKNCVDALHHTVTIV
jgi:hypothetical protein